MTEYANAAAKCGLSEICFTDHVPAPDGYDSSNRMDLDLYPEYLRLASECTASSQIPVLLGIEADYYRAENGFLNRWLPAQNFDIVLGSVHYIDDWPFDNPDNRSKWKSVDVTGAWKKYMGLLEELAETRLFDVISHFDLPKKFGYRPPDKDVKEMTLPVLDRVAKAGMAIEINTSGLRRPVKEIYPSPLILELAREREIPICFGSDSHRPDDVGYAFDKALKLALEAGYSSFVRIKQRKQFPESLKEPAHGD